MVKFTFEYIWCCCVSVLTVSYNVNLCQILAVILCKCCQVLLSRSRDVWSWSVSCPLAALVHGIFFKSNNQFLNFAFFNHSNGNFSSFTVSLLFSRHPRGGSFIRPNKANFGVDFLTAVKDRYGLDEKQDAQNGIENTHVIGKKTVEFVGKDSIEKKLRQVKCEI